MEEVYSGRNWLSSRKWGAAKERKWFYRALSGVASVRAGLATIVRRSEATPGYPYFAPVGLAGGNPVVAGILPGG